MTEVHTNDNLVNSTKEAFSIIPKLQRNEQKSYIPTYLTLHLPTWMNDPKSTYNSMSNLEETLWSWKYLYAVRAVSQGRTNTKKAQKWPRKAMGSKIKFSFHYIWNIYQILCFVLLTLLLLPLLVEENMTSNEWTIKFREESKILFFFF